MNDRRHSEHSADGDVIGNMALAISSRDLYNQSKEEAIKSGLKNENIPSHSWFRFQFWPKNPYTHHALNYTGRLKIRYMIQNFRLSKVPMTKTRLKSENQTVQLQLSLEGKKSLEQKVKCCKLPTTISPPLL